MAGRTYDLVVIGAGPGGEVGAIRAAQLGLKVALVETSPHLGGTCLNVGCIPTKALLESAKTYEKLKHLEELGFDSGKVVYNWQRIMSRKDGIVDQQRKGLVFLMKKNKIDVYQGVGRLKSATEVELTEPGGQKTSLLTKYVLLATGSRVRELPFAKSNGRSLHTSDSILFIDQVPKTLAVIGGGVVGMEFASLFNAFGSEVTVFEMAPQVLPSEDEETVKELVRLFKKQNIKIETSVKISGLDDKGDHVELSVEGKGKLSFAKVIIAIGREAVIADLALDKLGIIVEKGFVKVDEHYRTKLANVYAIGDIIATPALAHTASAEAIHAVEFMAGHNPQTINYAANPNAIYTLPEIASIGSTEKTLKDKNIPYKAAKFPFAPLAKAKIEGATDGFIKIIYEPKYREILGVHIIGAKATELIAEFVVGKVLETTVDEIALAIHPHPTISETVMEAAHAALHSAIHL